ncbi:jg2827 [Pararge aegeria aegeria]|uniref:Jg2827 protein n=1 Tax=Pararge aegeria aegeria TaxID=348720 RepID=A0A8S4QYU2_9NEOP|nr:jg2827 [Pararge aegeria aegeria]
MLKYMYLRFIIKRTFLNLNLYLQSDDRWFRNIVAYYGPHKKAQSYSADDGESYVRSIYVIKAEMWRFAEETENGRWSPKVLERQAVSRQTQRWSARHEVDRRH